MTDMISAWVEEQARLAVEQAVLARELAAQAYFHWDMPLARLWLLLFKGTSMEVMIAERADGGGFCIGMAPEIDAWIETWVRR